MKLIDRLLIKVDNYRLKQEDEDIPQDDFIEALGLDLAKYKKKKGDNFFLALRDIVDDVWANCEVS
ncbi:MAG: hypothetical protein E6370_11210 [Clostridiales bacterium]|nr:hypothetical protein [Clostridiales bacterium]MDU6974880.1 hypothetical protein [Clostridiales bacterium]